MLGRKSQIAASICGNIYLHCANVVANFAPMKANSKDSLLSLIRTGRPMSMRQQLWLTAYLSAPAIMAQVSAIAMQYIDAAMLGRLGANEAASVGLVSTTTWLFNGLAAAFATGFSVQVAHFIGANDYRGARQVVRQGITMALFFGLLIATIGSSISHHLPLWLGGNQDICSDASTYFLIYSCTLPFLQLCLVASCILRCSGNMKVPSMLLILMDLLDVVFNYFLIFPTHHFTIGGITISLPGANLGVMGAAMGTAGAIIVVGALMMWSLVRRSPDLNLWHERGSFKPTLQCLKRALKISAPMGLERMVMCGAQIMITAIVAPLGTIAIAANSFAVTAESLCYMPGYGISEAATTLIGQSIGAKRRTLTLQFAKITVALGIGIMTVMGIVMYAAAPLMMQTLTPHPDIIALGTEVLRIEAFAEPMFAASIVCYGVFVGAGDTLFPSAMNFGSLWLIRLTLSLILAPTMGLQGVWIAMCIELCMRGLMFLARLRWGNWHHLK